MYKSFEELLAVSQGTERKKVAVVWANEDHTLAAVQRAMKDGVIQPILIGEPRDISNRLVALGSDEEINIVPAGTPQEAVDLAVAMAREGKVDIILKGLVETAILMKAVVNKTSGLFPGGILSHISLVQLPNYHKLVAITDSALLTYPTLEQKKAAIINAVEFFHSLKYDNVKVAVLAAVEKVNPKMPETVEASAIKEAALAGEIPGCIVEGPISYDLAMRPGAAKIKGFDSPVAGDPDLLVVPNITAGNILIKALTYTAGGISAGLILGAMCPIVITSRSSSVKSKYTSLRVAAACQFGQAYN